MNESRFSAIFIFIVVPLVSSVCFAKETLTQDRYFAHPVVLDSHGVIAPWYSGQNGQCDYRIRIAAETLKRYPWTNNTVAVAAVPEYVFNGAWSIASDGAISPRQSKNWVDGDIGQRAAYIIGGMVDYYRYSGDPAAIAHLTLTADVIVDYCQTGAEHPWPIFLVSCPTAGLAYGQADPNGRIQLDIVAEVGVALVRAYKMTGNTRWFDAAKHWADVLAEKRNREPGLPPWNRYANPEVVEWEDQQTGGVVYLLTLFDELIEIGYEGKDGSIVEARDAGRAYLRDVLLPRWTVDETWGRNYWDWADPVQAVNVTAVVARYLMENPEYFPNWQNDARNVLSIYLNRTSVNPDSRGGVYSGAWAYPESSGCCDRALLAMLAPPFAQYGVLADSEWGREMARRQAILRTYDFHESGVVEDDIDGGQRTANAWFKAAHPLVFIDVFNAMSWLPEVLGPNRENHIMRSASVVKSVVYEKGRILYSTFDAPSQCVDVLRLAFRPTAITADEKPLTCRSDLSAIGYQVRDLLGGDCIVSIRHDGSKNIVVEGDDPQEKEGHDQLTYTGDWTKSTPSDDSVVGFHSASSPGATMTQSFVGNQVRLIGRADPEGGLADVYVDGIKQLVPIDCWNPTPQNQQILYYKNGLENTKHELKLVTRGDKNAQSRGTQVHISGTQWSAATGDSGFGEGGGPTEAQRIILGYAGRTDYLDSQGNAWRPGTEFVVRSGKNRDSVADSWWTQRRRLFVANTPDPELYRYGVHWHQFTVYFTVGPGKYHVRLKFMETRRNVVPERRKVDIQINGKELVEDMDIAATAGGMNRPVDLVFENIQPKNGVIEIKFTGGDQGQAIVQAIEVGSGDAGSGATPIRVSRDP